VCVYVLQSGELQNSPRHVFPTHQYASTDGLVSSSIHSLTLTPLLLEVSITLIPLLLEVSITLTPLLLEMSITLTPLLLEVSITLTPLLLEVYYISISLLYDTDRETLYGY